MIDEVLSFFTITEWLLVSLVFIWTGFVRTGLGFGGAALGLPLMLLLGYSPVFWLPIIGIHLLFFSSLTLKNKLHEVDWVYLKQALVWILPATLVGVFGLISLPAQFLTILVYTITLGYAFMWAFGGKIHSHSSWADKLLLLLGGYVAGISLTGAPLMVAVFMRHIALHLLRNTLFVLWFILVSIKMSTFILFEVTIYWEISLLLLPVAYIGHLIGLATHQRILANQVLFTRFVGMGLIVISALGLLQEFLWH